MVGMSLADSLRLKAAIAGEQTARAAIPSDTSVIFIWLPGGPPHMETYDMKPEAPLEYRGIFQPIKTNVPGIEICETLPMMASTSSLATRPARIARARNSASDSPVNRRLRT